MSLMHNSIIIDGRYLNSLPFPALVMNNKGRVTICGKLAEQHFGVSTSDFIGHATPPITDSLLRQLSPETLKQIAQNENFTYLENIQVYTEANDEITTSILATSFKENDECFF